MPVHTFAKHWTWTLTVSARDYSLFGQKWLQDNKDSHTLGMSVGKWRTHPATWRIQDFKLINQGTTVWIKGVVTTQRPVAKQVVVHHLEHTGGSARANVWSTIAPGAMIGRKTAGWRGYINSTRDF